MGTPKLKIKDELHYRRGYTHSHCSECNHYVEMRIRGINDADLGQQPRCRLIGLNPGRMYRINPASICARFDGSNKLDRLKVGLKWTHDKVLA